MLLEDPCQQVPVKEDCALLNLAGVGSGCVLVRCQHQRAAAGLSAVETAEYWSVDLVPGRVQDENARVVHVAS